MTEVFTFYFQLYMQHALHFGWLVVNLRVQARKIDLLQQILKKSIFLYRSSLIQFGISFFYLLFDTNKGNVVTYKVLVAYLQGHRIWKQTKKVLGFPHFLLCIVLDWMKIQKRFVCETLK
eukprot:TRINITY_DN1286_c0_g1_i11.p4 TRINITY_DN1286_c0_g1~~TRINITY_DN1286_c0_g1_i11.p4  ORF type:complete len:120 (-),score=0.68 TRINITY_DN1286_c0_g1_i11:896-1255(-)